MSVLMDVAIYLQPRVVSQPKFAIYCSLKQLVTEICRKAKSMSQTDHNYLARSESSSAFIWRNSGLRDSMPVLIGHEFLHELFIHVEIGKYMLNIVVILQNVEQLQ